MKKTHVHHDHADFLLPLALMPGMGMNAEIKKQLRKHIMDKCDLKDIGPKRDHRKIVLGHHLLSVLDIMNRNITGTIFAMVLVDIKNPKELFIDIPGGKRRLGENTFDCAVRETKEESSLDISYDIDDSQKETMIEHDNDINTYFLFMSNSKASLFINKNTNKLLYYLFEIVLSNIYFLMSIVDPFYSVSVLLTMLT